MKNLVPILNFVLIGSLVFFLTLIPYYDILPVILYLIMLSLVLIPLYKIGIKPADAAFPVSIFILAFLLKMAGGAARYWFLMDVYRGVGDAVRYHFEGMTVARHLSGLEFSFYIHAPQGTKGLIYLTGIFYALLPDSLPGIFFLFSAIAFTGSVVFYRSYRLAYPEGSPVLYRYIIFFLPSVVYWPSSLGKDAWIFFSSSLVIYGLIVLFRKSSPKGMVWTALGLVLTAAIRPHVAGFLIISAGLAYLINTRPVKTKELIYRFAAILFILFAGYFVLSKSTEFLIGRGLEETSFEGVAEFYQLRRLQSFGGGSKIMIPDLFSVYGPIYALVTVMLRPFPFEAHNVQALVSSLETTFWLGIFIKQRKVFISRITSVHRDPLIAFNVVYVLIMIFALSSAGNLGIIARQRVQFLPMLWMLFI